MATIHDVAEEAGVSPTTVSRYLNKRLTLPPATATRIDAAVARLEYRPNALARRLATGETRAVALLVRALDDPESATLAAAIGGEAERRGYALVVAATGGDPERETALLDRLVGRHADGVILATGTPDDGARARLLSTRGKTVIVGGDIPGIEAPRFLVDDYAAAYAAAQHLTEAGHVAVALVGGAENPPATREREGGFVQAMADAGLGVRREHLRIDGAGAEFGRETARALLRTAVPPTAILAMSPRVALGAAAGLRQAGLSIPGDVSLVALGGGDLLRLVAPAVTTVDAPVEAMGRAAFLALLENLKGGQAPALTRLPVTLVERDSVARLGPVRERLAR